MQYDVDTPSAYLTTLEADWRKEKFLEIRTIIHSYAPKILESIEYKMLNYKLNDKSVFHLNAQKNYVGLYVGNIKKVDPSGELLAGLNCGKGCIRITKSIDIQQTKLPEFIKLSIELSESGTDLGC
ncbi:DUF1801 domain-containing protein [Paraglaciecola aquimarina]|uniref:DUF1801 domain-containing protein n=1 Tax=Paraglaciecola algarum TaxID=3050085 RepID=A0ABS9D131_9ALTE|nr:DUF1801 domain-containing protein [Paraglaciecola sp. G1-23]MCF2946636.1 DUF1801 domain-containing protein [Paraglaciecola sp. G1-23]